MLFCFTRKAQVKRWWLWGEEDDDDGDGDVDADADVDVDESSSHESGPKQESDTSWKHQSNDD